MVWTTSLSGRLIPSVVLDSSRVSGSSHLSNKIMFASYIHENVFFFQYLELLVTNLIQWFLITVTVWLARSKQSCSSQLLKDVEHVRVKRTYWHSFCSNSEQQNLFNNSRMRQHQQIVQIMTECLWINMWAVISCTMMNGLINGLINVKIEKHFRNYLQFTPHHSSVHQISFSLFWSAGFVLSSGGLVWFRVERVLSLICFTVGETHAATFVSVAPS